MLSRRFWEYIRRHRRAYLLGYAAVLASIMMTQLSPWALKLAWFRTHGLGPFVFMEMVVFLGILVLGLAYAWRKGVLEWV